MALTVLSYPITTLLSTLDRVKAELAITDTSSDDLLLDMLTRASSGLARECGRPFFAVAQYQETLKGTGSQLLALSAVPVLQVSQVVEDQTVIDPTDTTLGYSIEDSEAGALYRQAGWGQGAGLASWGWEAYGSRYILPGGNQAQRYTVTYMSGYLLPYQIDYLPYDPTAGNIPDTAVPATTVAIPALLSKPTLRKDPPPLPGPIEQACLTTVQAWWYARMRDNSILKQKSQDAEITYDTGAYAKGIPSQALTLIRNYRRVV